MFKNPNHCQKNINNKNNKTIKKNIFLGDDSVNLKLSGNYNADAIPTILRLS